MIESPELTPIMRTSVADEIVKRLVDLILSGRLKPGDRLPSERELMARFRVGKSSLREAVKALRAVGVIEVAVGDGMYVGRGDTSLLAAPLPWGLLLSEQSAQEVIEARTTVEAKLAALAAERATDEQLAAIGEQLEQLHASLHDPEAYYRHDLAFHLAVGQAARNRVLYHVLESLHQLMRAWIERVNASLADRLESTTHHEAIYTAICARDPEAARQTVEIVMARGGARLLQVVRHAQVGQSGTTT